MRKLRSLILLFSILSLGIVSCSSDDNSRIDLNKDFLQGKWIVSSIETPIGLDYPFLAANDVFFFEEESQLEVISKMIISVDYLIDEANSSLFLEGPLSPLGSFELSIKNNRIIELKPEMYKGNVSILLERVELLQEKDLFGKWQMIAMTSFSIDGEEEIIEDTFSKLPLMYTDDIMEFNEAGKLIMWDNANKKSENKEASYRIDDNTLILTITELNRNPYTNIFKIISLNEDGLLHLKMTDINDDNGVVTPITTSLTFKRII